MKQDQGRAGSVIGVPDPSSLVFDVALIIWHRQGCGALRFEFTEVVIVNFHLISIDQPRVREVAFSCFRLPASIVGLKYWNFPAEVRAQGCEPRRIFFLRTMKELRLTRILRS